MHAPIVTNIVMIIIDAITLIVVVYIIITIAVVK